MNEEAKIFELILICADLRPTEDGKTAVRFGSQTNEEALIKMCQEDSESWNLVKKVINDTITCIETKAKEK